MMGLFFVGESNSGIRPWYKGDMILCCYTGMFKGSNAGPLSVQG